MSDPTPDTPPPATTTPPSPPPSPPQSQSPSPSPSPTLPSTEPSPAVAPPHPGGHERADVNVRVLVYVIVAIFIAAVVIHVALYFVYGAYDRAARRATVNLPLSGVQTPIEAPAPQRARLQGIPGYHTNVPRADMAVMNARNAIILNTYGPAPRPGLVRIPVERAMELALEGGVFKSRSPATRPAGGDHALR